MPDSKLCLHVAAQATPRPDRRARSCRPLLLLLLFLAGFAHAQPRPFDLPIKEHVLSNGLRLLVLHRPGDHRVACKIFTDMGAMNETPGNLGAAHFLEHMMFKGTRTLGTSNWEAERPLIDRINATERALIEAQNRARNDLRQRGVFHDYQHRQSTRAIDSLRAELARLDQAAAAYRDNGAMMKWYQAYGGARLTATTEQEYMKFDINLPKENVEVFLRVEADRMRNTIFREFDQERMILLEQRYGDLNNPTTPYYEAMNALVQTIHPVFWPEGYLTDFPQYTRQDLRQLYDDYFIANNTTLVFVGGLTLEELRPLVERYFGWMPRQPEPPRVKAIEPVPQAEKRLVWRSTNLAPRVEIRYLIPGIGHPERPHFDVLSEVLQEHVAARLTGANLQAQVRTNMRVVHTDRFGVPATMNIEAVLANGANLDRGEQVMLQAIGDLTLGRIRSELLERAKKRLRLAWYRTALNADDLAFAIGHFQVMDSWRTLEAHLETREKTTVADLQRLALRYLVPENRNVGIVRPPAPNR